MISILYYVKVFSVEFECKNSSDILYYKLLLC